MTAGGTNGSVMIVGGPDSGKSNYIFRLWLAIKDGNGAIRADGLPDQLAYLDEGAASLLAGEFAQRTQHDVVSENVIPFQADVEGVTRTGKLIVPDSLGERWMSVFKKRQWSQDWEYRIADHCGFIIFVRASSEQVKMPLDWIQCERLWGGVALADAAVDDTAPTQVVVTDWIQFIGKAFADRVGNGLRPRVALVVAAWDSVPHDRQALGPSAYIAQEFPLVSQFMQTNDDTFDFATFGVSIAGGDFKNEPGFKDRSLQQDNPLSGGYTMHELGGAPAKDPDLTLPVAWAVGFRQKVGGG